MNYLSPQPDEADVKATHELYRRKLGREITEGEAREVLYRVMLWLNLLKCTGLRECGESSPNELNPLNMMYETTTPRRRRDSRRSPTQPY